MGLSANEALANMLGRADTPAMRSFVRSILQGETLGVSIGKIMRDLAVEMRKRRRQVAEERVQKAPTKMLFPLVFLIFPAMFVVILGPAGIEILHTIAHKFEGGPVGLSTLAVAVSEEPDTIEDVYEPYLLQRGLIERTPRGRAATRRAFEHLGLKPPGPLKLL